MAIIPSARYSGQVETGDAGYPQGKARNAGAFQDGTGTPLERDWLNDLWGFEQALLELANLTPSGVPDAVGASQYLDAVRVVASAGQLTRALVLRAIDLDGVVPGTSQYLGAAFLDRRAVVVKGGTAGVFGVMESPLVEFSNVTTGLTEVKKVVVGSVVGTPRLLAIGGSGVKHVARTDNGTTWTSTATTGLGAAPTDGVWNGARFVISTAAGAAARSSDGQTWSLATGGLDISNALDTPDGGLAALASGAVVAAGGMGDGRRSFAVSADNGQTWAFAGSLPDSSPYAVTGTVAGNGGAEVYWIGKPVAASRLDVFASSDGASWVKRGEVAGFSSAAQPRLLMCPDTGALVAASDRGTSVEVSASVDRGRTWSAVVHYNIATPGSLALARGRLFATIGARLFASDPIAA